MINSKKLNLLILCTGNSCRSQIAEGITRHLYEKKYNVFSAGTDPTAVNKNAIKVMKEIDIDIANYKSKSIRVYKEIHFDLVITVCDSANESCSVILNKYTKLIHWPFKDPVGKNIDTFREVRDLIYNKFQKELKKHFK